MEQTDTKLKPQNRSKAEKVENNEFNEYSCKIVCVECHIFREMIQIILFANPEQPLTKTQKKEKATKKLTTSILLPPVL